MCVFFVGVCVSVFVFVCVCVCVCLFVCLCDRSHCKRLLSTQRLIIDKATDFSMTAAAAAVVVAVTAAAALERSSQ